MKLLQRIILCCLLLSAYPLSAQYITGTVTNENQEPLFGATIVWENTSIGTVADIDGNFKLIKSDTSANLVIDYVGYSKVLIPVEPFEDTLFIEINGITELMAVEVAAQRQSNFTSTINPINVETISSDELRKAPCCNLAESFETNASVDVNYSDAVTGAREIMMLGLRGTYTQMMIEKRPALTGLGSAFAMEYIPGTWLHSIQISKGAGSVQNGYQSITGQLNSELVKPFEDQSLFVNLYGSTFGRGELNIHLNKKLTDKWSAGLLLHGSTRHNEIDNNNDNFYDTSQKDMLDGMLRLFYRGNDVRAQFNIHALSDKHTAGQIVPKGGPLYSIFQNHERVEFFGKIGYLGFKELYNTLGFITNASWHNLDSQYGTTLHRGTQRNLYTNLMYNTILGSTDHKLNMGASFLYDEYDEMLNDSDFSRTEKVPGAFVEYSYDTGKVVCEEGEEELDHNDFLEKIGIVAGLRIDHHNLFGWLWTPRLNVKYNFSGESIIRLSGGRGYRTANVIAENISMLASNRRVVILEALDMEDAWNFGINFTQNFKIGKREASLNLDLYRTQFNNQVVMDREHTSDRIYFYNLDGESFANSFLSVFSLELIKGLDMKLAYKLNDVKVTMSDELLQRPFVAKHRGLVTLDYETPDEKWMFNTSLQLVGKQRFPHNHAFPDELIKDHNGYSPAFAKLGAQITRKFKRLEVYAGGENLTNYTQNNPIIDWQNPFGQYFDATQTYGPIVGAMGFVGLRFGIE